MDMKKILCAVLIVAASMTATLAAMDVSAPAPAPAPGAAVPTEAASDSTAILPVVGSLVGASILSFFALFFQ